MKWTFEKVAIKIGKKKVYLWVLGYYQSKPRTNNCINLNDRLFINV